LVSEYNLFLKRMGGNPQPTQPGQNIDPESGLTFVGRELPSTRASGIKQNHYKKDTSDFELYGPIWIYVTLLIEFVILGHLTN
jgi:hypothetical protein